mmetsp:Transcript_17831/g.17552  ORF Transcript_17831/g.17552 Transcript_17831/m.17552 type:complete len:103 (+) Transcript_17831:691-999(+)
MTKIPSRGFQTSWNFSPKTNKNMISKYHPTIQTHLKKPIKSLKATSDLSKINFNPISPKSPSNTSQNYQKLINKVSGNSKKREISNRITKAITQITHVKIFD